LGLPAGWYSLKQGLKEGLARSQRLGVAGHAPLETGRRYRESAHVVNRVCGIVMGVRSTCTTCGITHELASIPRLSLEITLGLGLAGTEERKINGAASDCSEDTSRVTSHSPLPRTHPRTPTPCIDLTVLTCDQGSLFKVSAFSYARPT
jgi:hypothetical protein